MIDELRQNVNTEIEILREISSYIRRRDYAAPSEKKMIETAIKSLRASAKMINNSIPKLLEDVTIVKQLPRKEITIKQLEKVEYKRLDSRVHVTLKVEDREKFFKELSISENLIRRIKKASGLEAKKSEGIKSACLYPKIANKYFLKTASNLISQGRFKSLYTSLRKANIELLLSSYVAIIIFTTLLAFIFSIILFIFIIFFKIEFAAPFISLFDGDYLIRIATYCWIPIIIPLGAFGIAYYYPTTEKDSLAKEIDQELPFAVIQMSAISSSGIAPSEIFKIIGTGNEYPYLKKEIRKILNQVNLYGYDLVTAIRNVSKSTPSQRLSELLSGICTTITSGGNLESFFANRAESLLTTYRLDREKYTRLAETFMDIYISIVVAAPMILMVLMVMMQISSMAVLSTSLIVLIVTVINVLFIIMLDLKQPTY